jgi:hypothetical protein
VGNAVRRYGRAGYGAAVFYVFLTVVHTGILGAMVTFAPTPFTQSMRPLRPRTASIRSSISSVRDC